VQRVVPAISTTPVGKAALKRLDREYDVEPIRRGGEIVGLRFEDDFVMCKKKAFTTREGAMDSLAQIARFQAAGTPNPNAFIIARTTRSTTQQSSRVQSRQPTMTWAIRRVTLIVEAMSDCEDSCKAVRYTQEELAQLAAPQTYGKINGKYEAGLRHLRRSLRKW
jgi:hypothetical protein